MSSPADATAAGLQPSNRQVLDFNAAPVIKRTASPADRALTKEAAVAYQRGELNVGPRTSFEAEAGPPPEFNPAAPIQSISPAPLTAPSTLPSAVQAIPVPTGPELRPTDPPRFQERINSLWRQKSEAEERAEALERRLSELTQRIDSRFAPQSPVPFTNQYGSSPGPQSPSYPTFESGQSPAPPAGSYVTREDVRALLAEQAQALMAQSALQQAHTVSRLEAERTYPDVFQNPEIKAAAEEIWRRDGSLRADPRGVEKAALMARGLAYGQHVPFSTGPQASPQARKEALSAIGPTVPEGQAAPNDQQARYNAAFAHAQRTQDIKDWARALRIARGQE